MEEKYKLGKGNTGIALTCPGGLVNMGVGTEQI